MEKPYSKRLTGFGALRGFRRLCTDLSRAAFLRLKVQGYLYPAPRLAVQEIERMPNMPKHYPQPLYSKSKSSRQAMSPKR